MRNIFIKVTVKMNTYLFNYLFYVFVKYMLSNRCILRTIQYFFRWKHIFVPPVLYYTLCKYSVKKMLRMYIYIRVWNRLFIAEVCSSSNIDWSTTIAYVGAYSSCFYFMWPSSQRYAQHVKVPLRILVTYEPDLIRTCWVPTSQTTLEVISHGMP